MTTQESNREIERLIGEIDALSRDVERRSKAVADGLRRVASSNGASSGRNGRHAVRVVRRSPASASHG